MLVTSLTISLGSVVALVDYQILEPVVLAAAEVAVQDGLGAVRVALLRIERSTAHMGDHGIPAAEGVLSVAEWVVLRCRLREPYVSSVSAEVAGLERGCHVLFDDDGASGCVDEPGSWRLISMVRAG